MAQDFQEVKWFREARFGMFIHWGLYSISGGEWKGMVTPWVSEWMMRKFKIPIVEYAKLAQSFFPHDFNAVEWVRMAKNAGMKYIVITSKHHDGFAMFHSHYDSYNIVDGTPFGRDPLAELAEACRNEGLKLGFYYSQDQDWHEVGGSGNDWDFPEKTPEMFAQYLEQKVKFQLRELLTNYGEICIVWFDTPVTISEAQSQMLKDYVHSLQPNCLVSGRVGNGKGDYESLGDNEIPNWRKDGMAEGIGTMNESWGYKPTDHCYKSGNTLIRTLCELVGKNANYLLNVGPDGRGKFPPEAVRLLTEISAWMHVNCEAIYNAGPIPTPTCFQPLWGYPTAKKNCIYLNILHCFEPVMPVFGIRNRLLRATVLGKTDALRFTEFHCAEQDYHCQTIRLPESAESFTVKLEYDGVLDANTQAYSAR